MTPDANAIADCVLSTFDQLPDKRKPRPRIDGSREWVPLSGIVLSKGNHPATFWIRFVAYAYRIAKMESSYACLWGMYRLDLALQLQLYIPGFALCTTSSSGLEMVYCVVYRYISLELALIFHAAPA